MSEKTDIKQMQAARIKRAKAALRGWYAEADEGQDEADIRDLLADVMHLAAEMGKNVEREVMSAQNHFRTERAQYNEYFPKQAAK